MPKSGNIKAEAGNYKLVIDAIKLSLTLSLDTVGRNPAISLRVSQLETNGVCQNEKTRNENFTTRSKNIFHLRFSPLEMRLIELNEL
jgi:hypothetical protein